MSCTAVHSPASRSSWKRGRSSPAPPPPRRRAVPPAGGSSPPRAAAGSSADTAQLKQALLQAVSRSNNPRPEDNPLQLEQEVEALAEALAAANPTPAPATSPLLLGAWALLFSGRSRRLAAAAAFPASASGPSLKEALQAASDAAYSTFYQYVPLLAGSAVGARRGASASASNTQVLRPGRVDNVVTAKAGPLPLRLCVSGSVETVEPAGGRPASCVAVRFDSFTAKAGPLPEAAVSLGWLRPLGYVDTLYLDGDLRVSVGDKGGLFVLRRVAEGGRGLGEREAGAAAAGAEAPAAAGAPDRG